MFVVNMKTMFYNLYSIYRPCVSIDHSDSVSSGGGGGRIFKCRKREIYTFKAMSNKMEEGHCEFI